MRTLVGAGLGVAFGIAALNVWLGLTRPASARRARPTLDRLELTRVGSAVVVGLLAGAFTGWVAAAVGTAVAGWFVPSLARAGGRRHTDIARVEAIATWTEQLRDTMAAGQGIGETIASTVPTAPAAIQPAVRNLAARMLHQRASVALAAFADELDDPTGDLVVAVLTAAIERSGRNATELLDELARTARERVAMRLRIDAERAATRAEARWVLASSAVLIVGMTVFARQWLRPFDSAGGQVALSIVGAFFAVGLTWLARLSRHRQPERFLIPRPEG